MSAPLEYISEADSKKLYEAKHLANFLADLSSHRTHQLTISNESFCVVMDILKDKLEIDTRPLKVQN